MHYKGKILQQRYYGFLQTPNLWRNNSVFNLNQQELSLKIDTIDILVDEKQCLGKYVEHFVLFNLRQQKNVKLLAENVQIQEEKRTIGELDCLFTENETPIHLEIVYKFYLYIPGLHKNELHCFIGPNRKDSLIEKLEKLKNKQLPLLYHSATKSYLNELQLQLEKTHQKVCFKAQLFIPYKEKDIQFIELNNDCIVGFYINQKELEDFKNCKFYIPTKKDWLIAPCSNVVWLNFEKFKMESQLFIDRKFSPLFWVKHKNGEIEKFFLVWWANSQ